MSFELTPTLRLIAMGLTFAGLSTGCNFRIKEAPPKAEVSGLGVPSCLHGASDAFDAYFAGNGDPARIGSICDCVSGAIDTFVRRVRGATPGQYTPGEVRNFMQAYFIQDVRVSDRLLVELMSLKQALVGGSSALITSAELERSRALIELVKRNLIRLQPYVRDALRPTRAAFQSRLEVDEASRALVQAARELGSALEKNGYSYSLDSFERMLAELDRVIGGQKIAWIREHMPQFRALKSVLVSPSSDMIEGSEWTHFFTSSARWYALGLKAAQLDPGLVSGIGEDPRLATQKNYVSEFYGSGRRRLFDLVAEAHELLSESVALNPGETIPFESLDRLIDTMPFTSGSPRRTKTVKNFLRPLFRNLLGGYESGPQGRGARGLTRGLLLRGWAAFQNWSEKQNYLEALFTAAARERGTPEILEDLDTASFSPATLFRAPDQVLESLGVDFSRPETQEAISDVLRILPENDPERRPLFMPKSGIIQFAGSKYVNEYSFYDLSRLSWMQSIVRLSIEGYSESLSRARKHIGLTQPEFKRACDDIRNMGKEFGFVDPRKYDMHIKRFRDANLFTLVSDGNDYLSLDEGTQFLAMLFSAQAMAKYARDEIVKKCGTGPLDLFGNATIDVDCYRAYFFGHARKYWSNFPKLVDYFEGLDLVSQLEFQRYIEEAARLHGYSEALIDTADSEALALMLHYIEGVFVRFDADDSGTLGRNEAHAAFPVLKSSLKEVIRNLVKSSLGRRVMLSDSSSEAVLMYMLAKGHKPNSESFSGKTAFVWWISPFSRWRFEADRLRVLRIFAELAEAFATPAGTAEHIPDDDEIDARTLTDEEIPIDSAPSADVPATAH